MSREPFRLLVLGGTRFLGRHLVQQALDAGHRVTLLHRSPTALFPEAEHRLGDRNRDFASLLGDDVWDAVADTSAYVPRQVRDATRVLQGRVAHVARYVGAGVDDRVPDLVAAQQRRQIAIAIADPVLGLGKQRGR